MLKKTIILLFCCAALFQLSSALLPFTPEQTFVVTAQTPPLNYDIIYVRAPRPGDQTLSYLPDALSPLIAVPGSDLMLLHPDGREEVLFAAGAKGAVADPNLSYDAKSVVFAFFPNARDINEQRGVAWEGADIYRLDLQTRAVTRLTFQEFTPNTGNGANFDCAQPYTNCPRVGVFNTGPSFLPDGRIIFTSTRDNFVPNKTFGNGQRTMQLYVMDGDGKNAQNTGHLNVAAAEHPFVLKDGRVVFTSWENMGLRGNQLFPLWAIWPDGTNFEAFSGFGDGPGPMVHHFMTQLTNGDIVVCRYYTGNNNGFGELYRFPVGGIGGGPLFDPIPPDNAPGNPMPLQRVGYTRLTPFTTGEDTPAPCQPGEPPYPVVPCPGGNNSRVGKFTQPSAAANNELLVVYTPGAANHNGIADDQGKTKPYYNAGIYRLRGDQILNRPQELTLIKNDPLYNEMWPRAVLSYRQIYGMDAPVNLPKLANDGMLDARLPEGTPLALIGASSLIHRDTRPFKGDRFFPHVNTGDRNWTNQGADAGVYTDQDIYAVRIIALQPVTDRSYPNNGRAFASHFSERVRILGEIPVRKEGVIDPQGNVDTSFLARIPADVPFTFQTLDRQGLVLNMAQTWHQVRPGEARFDCGGCHAHSKPSLDFKLTAASRPDYQAPDLSGATPLLDVNGSASPGVTTLNAKYAVIEYLRDIRPIFQAKCASCHSARNGQTPAAGLNLDEDDRIVDGEFPATYAALARSRSATNPTKASIAPGGGWWWPQVTRYIRAGQARQSLLVWKIFGRRLDGRTNADRPTERVPGDATTIPAGVDFSDCDLDYTGAQMPPPDSGITLTWEERMKIARWIDLGAPLDQTQIYRASGGTPFAGYLEDDLRPTLSLTPSTSQAAVAGRLTRFVIGAYDLESGIDPATLSLTLSRSVGNIPAGNNLLAGRTLTDGGTLSFDLPAPLALSAGEVTATLRIRDRAGHTSRIVQTYRLNAATPSTPLAVTNVSAANYIAALAPEAIVAAFGANLATATRAAQSLPLPTTLAGTSVMIRDSAGNERAAQLFFVSPKQINYLMPPGVAPGSATVTVTSGDGAVSVGAVQITSIAPGLFTFDSSGRGLPAAYVQRVTNGATQNPETIARFDQTRNAFVAVPVDLGTASDQVFLALFGTGFRHRSSLGNVTVSIGGIAAQVSYAGAVSGFAGLDQLNVLIPRALAGRGEADLITTIDGKTANTVRVNIK